jgi:D-sedoheptulose 7-phosphate isomerase
MDKSIKQYIQTYMQEAAQLCQKLDTNQMERMIQIMTEVRSNGGRLFFLGVGGSAANASHAVNDFRKIAGIESYSPTDNVSELTARINDDGWATSFSNWLLGCRINARDAVFVFSVGGGNEEKNVSPNIVTALKCAKEKGAKVMGIVGRDGGYTAKVADACVIIPTLNNETITPHAEAFQAVVWHMLVSHPAMRVNEMKWESIKAPETVAGHA